MKRQGKIVVKVWFGNFEGKYLTWDAYCKLRLQMSTGDIHTHKYELVEVPTWIKAMTLEEFEEFESWIT